MDERTQPGREAPRADVFGFSAGHVSGQGMRNLMAMMTLPWAMIWMIQSEMIAETLRRFGD